ncbi:MAG: ABC transporter ATP-binding protein [Anaerolineales bacterium]|nr:ABC transporter ATP-binding protein [Anaerolineales bacterium]
MSNSLPVVETRQLVKVYGDGADVRALDDVTFSVQPGEFVAIVGPSGAGKSTLLHLLGALDRPTSGDVILRGTSLAKVRDLDRFRSQTIGFVFQMHNLIPTLTAVENVEVPMAEVRLSGRQKRERARELLKLVGLEKRGHHLPNKMSGGERQRVAVARALANRPAILLADEPTGNLDSHTTDEIMDLLTALNRDQGTTLLVVTHNPQVAGVARRVITLRDGRIQSDIAFESAYEKDLIDLKHSLLGRAILAGNGDLPEELRDAAPALRQLLAKV